MGTMNNMLNPQGIASALNPMTNTAGQVMPGQVAQAPTAMNPVAMALMQRLGPAIAAQRAKTVGQNPGAGQSQGAPNPMMPTQAPSV